MKVLSLTQPWATLVVIGAKQFETRSWKTSYRGPLLIHASKKFPRDCKLLAFEEPFFAALRDKLRVPTSVTAHPHPLPTGRIIGKVKLFDCITTDEWMIEHCDEVKTEHHERELHVKSEWWNEYQFGDFSYGRFAWQLEDPEEIPVPIPVKGKLGLWEFPL